MAKKSAKKKVAKKKAASPKKAVSKKAKSIYSGLSVDQLKAKLSNATDPMEKRKIRAALRKLGHKGGMNKLAAVKKVAKKKSAKKKTAK